MFHHFGLKLLFWRQNLTFLGVNSGQMLKLNIFTPKGTSLRVPRILSHRESKSVKGFDLFAQKSPVNGFLPNLERTFPSWT